jgi:hypothetical protein
MGSRTNKTSVGNSHATYMREYRKRKRLEEDNCNDVPKRTKLNAERQCEYTETHKMYLLICNTLKITVTVAHKIKSSMSAC